MLLRARIVNKIGLDGAYFGLLEQEFARCAELVAAEEPLTLTHHALGALAPVAWLGSVGRVPVDDLRAALVPRASHPLSWDDPRLRSACIPSSTGVFTARALARMYAALCDTSLLSSRTSAAARAIQSRARDRVTGVFSEWRLGYHAIQLRGRVVPDAFGHCGYRGTGAVAVF